MWHGDDSLLKEIVTVRVTVVLIGHSLLITLSGKIQNNPLVNLRQFILDYLVKRSLSEDKLSQQG